MDSGEDTWTHVLRLMRGSRRCCVIKEAAIPVLTGGSPDQAWRTRRFLRLADRMVEDMHGLQFVRRSRTG